MDVEVFVGDSGSIGIVRKGDFHRLPADQGPRGREKDLHIQKGDEARAGMNVKQCLKDLEHDGFHIARAKLNLPKSEP